MAERDSAPTRLIDISAVPNIISRSRLPSGVENHSTRSRQFSRSRGNVRAKTGTLNGVSALSGYVRERFAFAVLVNTPGLSAYAAHAAQDRFATVLAQQR